MRTSASSRGSVSRLYWGFVRDRGTVLTSATSATSACVNKFTNSARGRVECPIVKTGKVICDPADRWIISRQTDCESADLPTYICMTFNRFWADANGCDAAIVVT